MSLKIVPLLSHSFPFYTLKTVVIKLLSGVESTIINKTCNFITFLCDTIFGIEVAIYITELTN